MKPHHTRYQHEQFCITNCFWGSQGNRPVPGYQDSLPKPSAGAIRTHPPPELRRLKIAELN